MDTTQLSHCTSIRALMSEANIFGILKRHKKRSSVRDKKKAENNSISAAIIGLTMPSSMNLSNKRPHRVQKHTLSVVLDIS